MTPTPAKASGKKKSAATGAVLEGMGHRGRPYILPGPDARRVFVQMLVKAGL
jgi:hypothetical protein